MELHLGRFENCRVTLLGWPVSWNRVFREVWGMLIGCVLFFPLSVCVFAACVFVFSFGCFCLCLGFLTSILSWTNWTTPSAVKTVSLNFIPLYEICCQFWKTILHIEPEIPEKANLIPLTRLILSIFFKPLLLSASSVQQSLSLFFWMHSDFNFLLFLSAFPSGFFFPSKSVSVSFRLSI